MRLVSGGFFVDEFGCGTRSGVTDHPITHWD